MKFTLSSDFNPILILKQAGYENHKRGFVRQAKKDGSRFHAIILENREIDLHYDKIVDGCFHSAAPKISLLKGEIRRIKNI